MKGVRVNEISLLEILGAKEVELVQQRILVQQLQQRVQELEAAQAAPEEEAATED